MRPPIRLVPDRISTDVVECTRELHEQALKGELTGLAFAATIKRRGYVVNSAGEAHRNPTFSRGMIAALDDYFAARVRKGSQ